MVTIRAFRGPAPGGFTLLELLVVLAIAGLLTSLVPSLISAVVPGARLHADAREMAVFLRAARNDAVTGGRAIDVIFEPADRRYQRTDRPARRLAEDVTLTVEPGHAAFSRGPADDPDNGTVPIRFYPDGTSVGAGIVLRRGNSAYSVEVDWLLGSARVSPGPGDHDR